MAKQIDLSKLSEKDLLQLRKDVDKAISAVTTQKKQDALNAVRAEANKRGFSLEDLMDAKKARKPKAPAAPKYRHPENPEVTWSGRGRQPGWIKDALARGQSLDAFEI